MSTSPPAAAEDRTAREASVDPTAFVHPTARIGARVTIGRYAFVGPHCVVGDGSTLMHNATVLAHTTMGADNIVHPGAVLGGDPQDRSYDPRTPGRLVIGDNNIFREQVTISRSTGDERPTRVGNGCMFMACSHAGHNALVGNGVVFVNCAVLAGWTEVGDNTTLAGFCGVHQFCRIGEGVMCRGRAAITKHIPPFVVVAESSQIIGLNRVGIRRNANLTAQDRVDIRVAFRAFYEGPLSRPLKDRLGALEALDLAPAAERFRTFIVEAANPEGRFRRGIAGRRPKRGASMTEDSDE